MNAINLRLLAAATPFALGLTLLGCGDKDDADDTGETGARRNDDSERCSVRGVAGMFADVSLNVNAAPSLRVTYCVW